MDWTPENPDSAGQASAAAADPHGSVAGRRPPARKISHRKNPSDTFAFAAGHLFHSTPEDFYNLLETSAEFKSDACAAAAQQGASSQQAPRFADDQQHLMGQKSASTQNLQSQGFGAAATQSTVGAAPPAPGSAAAAAAAQQDQQHPEVGYFDSTAQQQAAPEAEEAAEAAEGEHYEYMQEEHDHDQDYEHELDEQHQRRRGHHRSGSGGSSGGGTRANALDTTQLDPRRAKRILANRQSAQRSRMKRLQYIHDLENRSATAAASLKELQREFDKVHQKQAELNGTVESSRAKIDSLAQQLFHEQQLQAALVKAISDLRSHASYIQQQQQLQQWPQSQQHMPNGSMYPEHQRLRHHQQQYQQQYQPMMEIKREPLSHPAAAASRPVLYGPQHHAQQPQQEAFQRQEVYHHQSQQQGCQSLHGPGRPAVYEQPHLPHFPAHAGQLNTDAGQPTSAAAAAAAPNGSAQLPRISCRGTEAAGAGGHLVFDHQQQQGNIQQLALQQRAGRASPYGAPASLAQQQQQAQAQLPPQHPAVPTGSMACHRGPYSQGNTATVVLPGVVVGTTAAAPLGFQVSGTMHGSDPMGARRSNSGGGGGSSSGMHTLQQQQQSGDSSSLSRGNSGSVLRQSPSPSQALGIDFDRSLSMGLASSMSTPMASLEGDLGGMLTEHMYMDAGFGLAPSGPLQLGNTDSFTLKQDALMRTQAAAGLGVDLRKTSSM